jgi:acyl transferase domain-containing protein/acyl carrier protein
MTKPPNEAVAIVGMSCRYAGAPDLRAFWDLLVNGREGVGDYSPSRTPELDVFYGAAGSEFGPPSRRGGFLPDIDSFDADFFGISPREAALIDPQQRLLLELAWEALEDAGLLRDRIAGPRSGVFVGIWAGDYGRQIDAREAVANIQSAAFNELFAASGRLAFFFDFQGPEVSVNSACASSLVALHQAVAALRANTCDVAFVAGINAIVRPEITQAFGRAGILSRDGTCKFGDANADGFVRSDGGGVLVLKRLSQAMADDDRIRAVIRGSAINNSGSSGGFIHRPSETAQTEVILAALRDGGLSPADVQYVEAHGTGTSTGDAVELTALADLFSQCGKRTEPCLIGSVKSNIGHAEAAAGMAGVIKTVLAFERRYLPPTLHVRTPNPAVDWARGAIELNAHGRPWPCKAMRRAGVSSFGIGGTNAHVVLEEGPVPSLTPRSMDRRRTWALPLSTNSPEALRILAAAYADWLERDPVLADVCFTAARRRSALPHRLVALGDSAAALVQQLRRWSSQEAAPSVMTRVLDVDASFGAVFVFPGQGSQWLGMARELLAVEPAFAAVIARGDEAICRETGWSVRMLLDANTDWETAGIEKIQPTLFAVQVALAELWASWGVKPAMLVGHSMGEVAAAHIAGALSLEDAAAVICRRSALMTRLGGVGEMALVELNMDEAQAALRGFEDRLSIAVSNGPRSTVLSGEPGALRAIVEKQKAAGIFCRPVAVQVAAHSPQMDRIRADLLAALVTVKPRAGHTPLYSTTLGRFTDGADFDAHYWVRNLRDPVLFHAALKDLIAEGRRTFVEISPHPVLLPAIQESGDAAAVELLTLSSMRREEPEQATMLEGLARLFAHGAAVDWSGIYPVGQIVDLPGHPWLRRRYWPSAQTTSRIASGGSGHPLLLAPFRTADGAWIWSCRLGSELLPWLKDHAVRGAMLLPATAFFEIAATLGRQILGHSNVVVSALQFKEAITLSQQEHALQVMAQLERAGRWSLAFYTHHDVTDVWTLAATATITANEAPSVVGPTTAALDALETGNRPDRVFGDAHALWLKRLGYDFGHDFLNLKWLDFEDQSVRGFARLSDALNTAAYALHPALLDAGLQAVVAGIVRRSALASLLIPRSIGAARLGPAAEDAGAAYIFAEVATSDAQFLGGDVRLYAPDGRLIAELREVEFQAFGAARDCTETSLLYRLNWKTSQRKLRSTDLPQSWLVLADEAGFARAFAIALGRRAKTVEVIDAGPEPGSFSVATIPTRIERLSASGSRVGIVHFGSFDLEAGSDASEIADNVAAVCGIASAAAERGNVSLLLITAGACAAVAGDPVSVPQASVWGLGGVIANEFPGLACRLIDIPARRQSGDVPSLVDEVLSGADEPRVALRGGKRLVARLEAQPAEAAPRQRPLSADENAELTVATPGVLNTLTVVPASRRPPGPGEVEITVEAAGLNFLDVIRAMGAFDPLGTRIPKLGAECAGTIARVGPGVTEFAAGDRVVAMSPALQDVGTVSCYLVTRAALTAKAPAALSMAEAAALPCAYLTAYFALIEVGRLHAGETILIHSATGGVGMAAIQIARWIDAKIIASAGSEAKRALLHGIGVDGVIDSRAAAFADTVLELTGGRGVDAVLNSLSGDAISEGLAALAPYGRFLEIGKRDMWDDSHIGYGALLLNRSIFGVDLATMIEDQPERVGAMLRTVMELVRDSVLAPLPTMVFPASRSAEAFQLMAAARHTGKIVIETRVEKLDVDDSSMPVRPDGSYLITGGLGALGLVAAEELVAAGARSLVLCGRAAPSEKALQVITTLRARGVTVVTGRLDVADEAELRTLLDEAAAALPPLRGIVHAAGVLDDGLVGELSAERFRSVMRGKVEGARLLDRLTADRSLDFFVLFSSVAAVLGSPGQGNYAAANAMLDALAVERRARGKQALSIAWGPWAEIGLAAAEANRGERIAERGLKSLSPDEGRRLFRQLLGRSSPYLAAMHFDPTTWLEVAAPSNAKLFDDLIAETPQSTAQEQDIRNAAAVKNLVMAQLAAVLRIEPERLANNKPFRSLGLDSLMGLELRNRLERALGMKLSASTVWNFPTANQLSAHLAEQLGLTNPPAEVSGVAREPLSSAAEALEAELLEAKAVLADL